MVRYLKITLWEKLSPIYLHKTPAEIGLTLKHEKRFVATSSSDGSGLKAVLMPFSGLLPCLQPTWGSVPQPAFPKKSMIGRCLRLFVCLQHHRLSKNSSSASYLGCCSAATFPLRGNSPKHRQEDSLLLQAPAHSFFAEMNTIFIGFLQIGAAFLVVQLVFRMLKWEL